MQAAAVMEAGLISPAHLVIDTFFGSWIAPSSRRCLKPSYRAIQHWRKIRYNGLLAPRDFDWC
jgi:hypothetical protein